MFKILKRNKNKGQSGNFMSNLSKLSKAFMLPIALLPIAGLMLGIGSTLLSQSKELSTFWWLGRSLKMIGNVPFVNLPGLFAISIAIAYTKNSGAAGLTAFVGWLAFNALISSFMRAGYTQWEVHAEFKLNWRRHANDGSNLLNISDTDFKNYVFVMKDNGYIPPHNSVPSVADGFAAPQLGMKEALANNLSAKLGTNVLPTDITILEPTKIIRQHLNYNLLFWKDALGVNPSMVTPILGIGTNSTGQGMFGGSLNTGVFGGIIVGALVAKLYNKYHEIKLPKVISFFSGVRFVPIMTLLSMIPLAVLTICIWPGLGILLNGFGEWTGTLPLGLDSFVFGLAKRALIPFGLHHVFYAPLWWSGAGGQLSNYITPNMVKTASTLTAQGDQSMMMAILADGKLKIQEVWDAGLHVGRFQSGEFAMMMFSLPAMAVAMWLSCPKENRKAAMGIYIGSAVTSFLTGITEPLEFTFLFAVPQLYYLVHVPIFASSYMLANITGIRIGMTFSGGMLDWIIFGILPVAAGHQTNWWLVPIEGIGYGILEFTIFWFLFKKYKWNIPGMVSKTNLRMFTKDDLKNKGSGATASPRILAIIKGLGGIDNLVDVDACATRLRVKIKNPDLINANNIKSLGAIAVVVNGNNIQSIFGGEADNIKTEILKHIATLKEKSNSKKIRKVV